MVSEGGEVVRLVGWWGGGVVVWGGVGWVGGGWWLMAIMVCGFDP